MNESKEKGITLVVLVITIVILLILAGITINQLTGENGLFARAKQAAEESKYANAEEKVKLAVNASYDENATLNKEMLKESLNKIDGISPKVIEVTWDLTVNVDGYEFTITELGTVTCIGRKEQEKLPDNTPDTPQDVGKEVALKDGWGTQTVKYIKTSDGTEVTELETVSTVYAVSVGNGDTVPVPKGFFYVGGNLSTGVIISDNEADKYEKGKDKTTYEYTTNLKGNQFVWIPCSTSEYKKCNSWNGTTQTNSTLGNTWWDTTTPKSELTQIEKYGGFYVGRYEAGLASKITEFTENQVHTGSNQVYNLEGVPQSKAGVVPWMFIDWTHAKTNAESMYNNNYISSGLITGTQWDVILNKMVSKNVITASDLTDSSAWGNYTDNSISYTGRLAKADYNSTNSNAWTLKPFGMLTSGTTTKYSSNNGDLLTTGASSTTERYHIFDLAGNLWEWTEETSFYGGNTSTQYCVLRGGSYIHASATYPACCRFGSSPVIDTSFDIGFRTILYIK